MANRIIATGVSRPVPDQLRIEYRLESADGGTLIDTGSVTMTFPYDPSWTTQQRRQRIRDIFKSAVRERVQALRAADADYAAIQTAVSNGTVIVTEDD